MQFKVGDRVEAIRGPSNTQHDDYVGPGTVIAYRANNACGEDYQLALDMGEGGWWFAEDSLRSLKSNSTPSITVGTQVRLTGVVSKEGPEGVQILLDAGPVVYLFSEVCAGVEVIRQPFKRGEVVWSCGAVATGEQYVVFNDETNGRVDVVHCLTGTATTDNDISRFERRP